MNYAPKKKELLNGFEAFFKKHGLEGIEEINRARQTLIGVLETRQYSLYALYSYVYKSQLLNKINEALNYGFSSLKNHLLLMVNLYINELAPI